MADIVCGQGFTESCGVSGCTCRWNQGLRICHLQENDGTRVGRVPGVLSGRFIELERFGNFGNRRKCVCQWQRVWIWCIGK